MMKRFEELLADVMDEEKYTDEELKGNYTRVHAFAWMKDIKDYQLGDLATGKVEALAVDKMATFTNLFTAVMDLKLCKSWVDDTDVDFGGKYCVSENYLEDENGNIVTIH